MYRKRHSGTFGFAPMALPSYLTKARPRLGATALRLCDEDGLNWEDLTADERGEYEDRAWEEVSRWDRRRRERDGR